MKTLLRSTFIADPTDNTSAHLENFRLLDSSGIEFDIAEDVAIWNYTKDFTLQHHHCPELGTIQAHFERTREDSIVDRLNELRSIRPRSKGDFKLHLDAKGEDRRKVLVGKMLQEAGEIVTRGITVEEGKGKHKEKKILIGPIAAIKYLLDKAHDVVAPTTGSRLSGNVTYDGDDFVARYDRVKNDPNAGVGQHMGIEQSDHALGGAKRFELWTHAAFTGGLKCVSGETRIWDTKSGAMRTVGEIYESQSLPVVHALNQETWRMQEAPVGAVVENGIRPIILLESEKGRSIRVSGNHPFLTPSGWVEADNLAVGDWVAVPSRLPNECTSRFTDAGVCLMGYLLGDGTMGEALGFTNGNPEILSHFRECLQRCGYEEKPKDILRSTSGTHYSEYPKSGACTTDIHISRADGVSVPWVSSLRVLLDKFGLWGCGAAGKFIPMDLWAITDAQMWLLLSALWSTDGRVGTEPPRQGRKARGKVWYGSTSHQLCIDVQACLQRLGVPSTVEQVDTTYKGEPYTWWMAQVTTPEGLVRFLQNVKIIGKEAEVAEAMSLARHHDGDWVPTAFLGGVGESIRARSKSGGWLYNRHIRPREKVQRDTFRRLAIASGDAKAIQIAESDVRWERLTVKKPDGEEMTYDLSVPGPANFVANGFITHNSTLQLNWAYNQAVYFKHDVLIFSLEMPYDQCRNLLYALHSAHDKFERIHGPLDYQAIKEGTLDADAERFMKEWVVPDLNDKDQYGSLLIEVADPEKEDFTVADIRHRAETLYAKHAFRMIFVDHALLVSPRHWVPNTTDRINEVIRDCKKMAMGFNKGEGIAVVLLFQINREGYKAAKKARGLDRDPAKERPGVEPKPPSNYVYDLTHLASANECLSGVEPVLSARGTIPIQEVVVGDEVWSRSGWKPVSAVFNQGLRPTWRVRTDRGSTLETTADHRVRVLREEQVTWSKVSDLTVGDWVLGVGGLPVEAWPKEVPPIPLGTGQLVLTTHLAYLLGVWDGDGRVRPYGLGFTGNRKEHSLRIRISSTIESVFGISPLTYEHASRLGSFDMETPGDEGVRKQWFESMSGPRGEIVPEIIFRAPRLYVINYLQGLYDTDGWVTKQGQVGVKMKSYTYLTGIQHLLTMLGYDSTLERTDTYLKVTGKTYEGWTLRLRGHQSIRQFSREINFTEKHKWALVQEHAAKVSQTNYRDTYPVATTFLALCKDHPVRVTASKPFSAFHCNNKGKAKKRGLVSRGAIQYYLDYLASENISDPRADLLQEILDLHVVKVASVAPTGRDEQVYDIEVGGDHEYASGPLFSHNCERSSDIVTATYIDEVLSKEGRVLMQCLKSRDQKPFDPFFMSILWPCRRLRTLKDPTMTEVSRVGNALDGMDDL